jgi:hypothetical protein
MSSCEWQQATLIFISLRLAAGYNISPKPLSNQPTFPHSLGRMSQVYKSEYLVIQAGRIFRSTGAGKSRPFQGIFGLSGLSAGINLASSSAIGGRLRDSCLPRNSGCQSLIVVNAVTMKRINAEKEIANAAQN